MGMAKFSESTDTCSSSTPLNKTWRSLNSISRPGKLTSNRNTSKKALSPLSLTACMALRMRLPNSASSSRANCPPCQYPETCSLEVCRMRRCSSCPRKALSRRRPSCSMTVSYTVAKFTGRVARRYSVNWYSKKASWTASGSTERLLFDDEERVSSNLACDDRYPALKMPTSSPPLWAKYFSTSCVEYCACFSTCARSCL
mmetsp:Transcript_2742/g.5796  ORF Transcript_2742/g.5796 Transcript_2742/m.5796 type:complete len:200 (-) Transcript_2742:1268-1867(-)